jgi:DNA-binding MarR family transcriptional regulator
MNEIDLHAGQVFILISLWNNDAQSQIDLAANLNISAASINKMVKSLMQSGFISCKKCTTDSRVMRVYLTQKGIDQQKLVEEKFIEFETEFFSNISETEKLILTQIFGKLNENFTKKKSVNNAA